MRVRFSNLLTVAGTLLPLLAMSPTPAQPAPRLSRSGLDLCARDISVRPGDDFFRYCLGSWEARTVIRDDQTETGADVEVEERVQGELRLLIERSASSPQNPTEAQIGALYRSFMDEARKWDLAVNVWTGEDDSKERFGALGALDVDGVITSSPGVALDVARASR